MAGAFVSTKAPVTAGSLPVERSWWQALGAAFISVFYAYGGYQNTINFGADVRNARRNVPRAIFFGILIVLGIFIFFPERVAFLRAPVTWFLGLLTG